MHVVEVSNLFMLYRFTSHLLEMQFNCYEFTSDVVPFAEKKLTTDLDQGQFWVPDKHFM